jgi:alkylhydroperoxidase family enzyme
MASHTALARRHGATDELLEVLGDPAREPLTDAEKAAVRFAEKMTTNHRALERSDMDGLRTHFSPEQIVELVCVVGAFNYLNRFSIASGLWPTRPGEGGPEDREGDGVSG